MSADPSFDAGAPHDSLASLFRRFLGFGFRAWGGPAAQLAMIRHTAVEEWKWIESHQFNRLLAVYQVLPGPEATEMCVHLGYLRRGRPGGLVAGLGFMLPGFILMLALAMLYVAVLQGTAALDRLAGFHAAVAALIAVACIRLGGHAVRDERLMFVFVWATALTWLGAPFWILLPTAALGMLRSPFVAGASLVVGSVLGVLLRGTDTSIALAGPDDASLLAIALSGLQAGLLTFGGAYTALPFLERDAVGSYVTGREFLDGVALAGILPAPFIIFATFLGYVGGGLPGALLMTAGIFLPAFAFTLLGAKHLERVAEMPRLHRALDGVTAAVIGLLTATFGRLLVDLEGWQFVMALGAFFVLLRSMAKWLTPVVVLLCGAIGWLATA